MTKPNEPQDGQRHGFQAPPAHSSIKFLCWKEGCRQPREAEIHARYALSGRCDNGNHSACPYPDKCRCDCHEPAPQQPEPLKPCPFCLKSADAREIKGAGYSLVGCSDPSCVASLISALPIDWNRREDIALASAEGEKRGVFCIWCGEAVYKYSSKLPPAIAATAFANEKLKAAREHELTCPKSPFKEVRQTAEMALEWFAGFPHKGEASEFDASTASECYDRLTRALASSAPQADPKMEEKL